MGESGVSTRYLTPHAIATTIVHPQTSLTGGTPLPEPVKLGSDGWESMTTASWSDDDRMAHLRSLWSRLVDAVQDGADSVAA